MNSSGNYVLRRAAGGVSHFARVAVSRREREVAQLDHVPRTWLVAVRRGVDAALAATGRREEIWDVTAFEGTVADTNDGDAWAAGVMAVLDALNVQAALAYQLGWVVILPSGERLVPATNE